MIDAVVFFNKDGNVLLSKVYRKLTLDDELSTPRTFFEDLFKTYVIKPKKTNPIVNTPSGYSLLYTTPGTFYVCAITSQNVCSISVFSFLNTIIRCFQQIGNKGKSPKTPDEILRGQIILLEILNEIADNGIPLTTDSELLASILQVKNKTKKGTSSEKVAIQATGAVSHRKEGIHYSRNEIWCDVVESIDLHVSATGSILSSVVDGFIKMKSHLSGMPELRLGINDKVQLSKQTENSSGSGNVGSSVALDDLQFHPCVRVSQFDANRSITFIPPDKVFRLLRYRVTEGVSLPFSASCLLSNQTKSKVELQIILRSHYPVDRIAQKCEINIPCPPNTASVDTIPTKGKAKFETDKNRIIWKVPNFQGQSTNNIRVVYTTSTLGDLGKKTNEDTHDVWPSRPPIMIDFEVQSVTASGMRFRYLEIHEPSLAYRPEKWVRYATKSGNYTISF